MIKEIPVLICGGGSVGLSLAAELGWRNVECLVFDQGEALNPHPRANAVANRTMEYYRRWGIDQTITEAGGSSGPSCRLLLGFELAWSRTSSYISTPI